VKTTWHVEPADRRAAIEACAMMASSNRAGAIGTLAKYEPCTRLADAIDVDSEAGKLATAALAFVTEHDDAQGRERWLAAQELLEEGWTP
jgi:hypothetical protein